jgi:two-component system sensor histidine kinase QseC
VSIRRRLLVLLLSVVSGGWLVAGLLTYRDARHEVEEVFDASLAQTARVLLGLLGHEVEEEARVQRDVARVLREIGEEGQARYPILSGLLDVYREGVDVEPLRLRERVQRSGHRYESRVALLSHFPDGGVLIRTPNAPDLPRAPDGFSDFEDGTARWRVFSLTDPDTGLLVQVAENQAGRAALVREITGNALVSQLVTLPVLALLVWVGVGQGLRPLRQVTAEVERREPDALDPVREGNAPPEVRSLVRALNALLARLDHALQQERRFTADAAHELRTPLAAIKTQAQVALRADEGGGGRRRALVQIVDGVDRATHLVEQLLSLARADALSSGQLPLADLDLRELVAAVLEDLVPAAVTRGVAVGLVGGPARLRGDPQGLRLLVRNLVDNAVRYTPAGGLVEVGVEARAGETVLRVTDTGPGIPPEQRDAMFERFRRGQDETAPGTGLGLSIVKRVANLHRARVALTEGPGGRGLQVQVAFPT